ncbi:class I SAM-dependent DNA methyltransferase [uncultured Treponema sp.]|uniref:type I restriction-modification system subunit M n=1 Tax=uncultured Treponema sp. TaxID=162155 RepID=UPI002595D7BC|nr:class I SAM-dependent DNA methyltransferase [uncultured Treponema sp.]
MTSDQMINKVGGNIQEKAALIWNVANTLVGLYKPHEYGLVILPMCIIKRFHDCLLPTHKKVLETYEKIKALEVKDGFLSKASGYQFYNTSKFTFETLVADPDNIADNFEDYINGFSDNVKDILYRMKFEDQIKTMKEGKVLYQVISDFNSAKADMNPEKISAIDMGYIFENLVQRFSESYDEEAGAHFTSRDIIYTMCDLLVSGDKNAFSSDGINKTVYDMTMGTSQMVTCMEERLRQFDKAAVVTSFGQEFNPFTFGIAKADMLIRGGDPDNMQFGDTLNDDKFSGYTFDYIISNPPFGIDWKKEASDIEKESKLGAKGRFGAGLPPKSDGQLLFMLNGVAKLKETGRMAIIQNGSSLFSGDAGSGQSEIRRYLIENDWLDAIIQLPNDSFYNTGIATYIWIVTKNKDEKRLGRVQLIDASSCYESRRKNIGNKRVDLTTDCRNLILRAYDEYSDKDYEEKTENGNSIICKSKVLDSVDLGYNKITVESPLLDENGETVKDKKGKTLSDSNKRDYENVPLDEDIDKYFEREVLPYNKASWIDKSKTKVGYEIPFTRTFYVYKQLEKADEIASRIEWHEKSLMEKLRKLFGEK